MHYELWDTETGNLVGTYDAEEEALVVVRDAVRLSGPAAVETLALGVEYDDEGGEDGTLPPVLSGAELLARAQATGSAGGKRISA